MITRRAIGQAFARGIAYPDQIITAIRSGKQIRVGKQHVKFISKDGIICVAFTTRDQIVVLTVERGNPL